MAGEVLEVKSDQQVLNVSMAFANAGEAPVRAAQLLINNHVTALDVEDFACLTQSIVDEFTVPAKAKAKFKVAMQFKSDGNSIAKVRQFDAEFVVANDRIKAAM